MNLPVNQLIEAAKAVRQNAYAPFSEYQVGAAILGTDGQIWAGCNVEFVSYGLCICAERSALTKMVSAGGREIAAVAVVTRDGATPCGMCRQSLIEFAPDPTRVQIVTVNEIGESVHYTLQELLPYGFLSQEVK